MNAKTPRAPRKNLYLVLPWRSWRLGVQLILLTMTSMAYAQEKPVIKLWPTTAPGETGAIGPEEDVAAKAGQRQIRRITNVTQPTLTIYKAPAEKDTGAAVVIAPGGGYHILAFNYEGTEVAEWL